MELLENGITMEMCSGLKDNCLLLVVFVLKTCFITQGLLTTAENLCSVM